MVIRYFQPNRGSVLRVYFVSDLSAGLTINKQRNGIALLIAYAGSQTLYTMFKIDCH
jgi:glutamine cyclotransferase